MTHDNVETHLNGFKEILKSKNINILTLSNEDINKEWKKYILDFPKGRFYAMIESPSPFTDNMTLTEQGIEFLKTN